AFLAAELVAFAGCGIQRTGNMWPDRIAVGAAGIFRVDRQRRTGTLHGHRPAIALALFLRRRPGAGLTGIVIGLAISTAFADRKRARRPGRCHETLGHEARPGHDQSQRQNENRTALRERCRNDQDPLPRGSRRAIYPPVVSTW